MTSPREDNPEQPARSVDAASLPLANAGYLSLGASRSNWRWRGAKDGFSKYFVGAGGISVILALALIFLYLFSEVAPMLKPASITHVATYDAPGHGSESRGTTLHGSESRGTALHGSESRGTSRGTTLHVAMERYREVAVRFSDSGGVVFFDPATGATLNTMRLPIPEGVTITSVGAAEPRTRLLVFGLSDGRIIIVEHDYTLTYPDDVRLVTPRLNYPFGEEPIEGDEQGRAIAAIGVQRGTDGSVAAAFTTADGSLRLVRFSVRRTLFASETTRQSFDLVTPAAKINNVLLSMDLRDLLVGDDRGYVHHYDVSRPAEARRLQSVRVIGEEGGAGEAPEQAQVTAMAYLLGTVSLIVGGSDGSVTQWMLVRDEDNIRTLRNVRSFRKHNAAVTSVNPEHARKGFVTADALGTIAIHFSTAHETLLSKHITDAAITEAVFAPRADGLFVLDADDRIHYYNVNNPHPQASLSALWGRVWYEGYSEPQYRWESSSATDEFEPKLSLVPLTVGTIKAAFYAMLFATPLAIMGAMYSAYFMTPRMRGFVKPSIEIMEALPTVILGFLAGLWFAPFVENHLPAVFSVLILMPLGMLVFALAWSRIPANIRGMIPDGWEAAILIPVVLGIGWACVAASPIVEVWFFGGSMRQWFTDIGITYDQRNALIVGIAMGFAVIPTIFSITEDAIFNVPRHLTQGSLALGATPWQTMMRVVLLTASPGIFSAVMIGLGRAVGETMIVLMATGNSPITNFNIFEGMRTLSANIAVEMPETEVGGTHYRILFLSALVLFVLTFAFNTAAEIVRQRLRKKYASI